MKEEGSKMNGNEKKTMETQSRQNTAMASRGNGGNGRHTAEGPLSWYSAQHTAPGMAYALTMNGYVVVSSKN
jgi:hypothetical protein